MKLVTFKTPKEERLAFSFGEQKINLHEWGREFEPKAHVAVPGSLDLCFIASVPLDDVIKRLAQAKVTIVEGPVKPGPDSVEKLAEIMSKRYGLAVGELIARLNKGRFRVKGNLDQATAEFEASGAALRSLLSAIAATPAFLENR